MKNNILFLIFFITSSLVASETSKNIPPISSRQLLEIAINTRRAHTGLTYFEKNSQELLKTALYFESTLSPRERVIAHAHLGESYMFTEKNKDAALKEFKKVIRNRDALNDQKPVINAYRMTIIPLIEKKMVDATNIDDYYKYKEKINLLLGDIFEDYIKNPADCLESTYNAAQNYYDKNKEVLRS